MLPRFVCSLAVHPPSARFEVARRGQSGQELRGRWALAARRGVAAPVAAAERGARGGNLRDPVGVEARNGVAVAVPAGIGGAKEAPEAAPRNVGPGGDRVRAHEARA